MRKLSSYINKDLQHQAKYLHRLTLSLRMHLPEDLANHCWVANVENRILTIVTDDPSRASALRFQQLEILKQLNSELSTVNEYLNQIKVSISKYTSGIKSPTEKRFLYPKNDDPIKKSTGAIKHLALKNTLQKLSD